MRLVTAAAGTFIGVLGTTLHAQALEPRAYSNSPVGLNFVIAGYGYAAGTVLTDPFVTLEHVNARRGPVFRYDLRRVWPDRTVWPHRALRVDRRERSRLRSAAYTLRRRLCGYGIPLFDEFRRRARADGGGVQELPPGFDLRHESARYRPVES